MPNEEWYYEDCSGEKHTDPDGLYTREEYPCVMCGAGTHRSDMTHRLFIHLEPCLDQFEEFLERIRQDIKDTLSKSGGGYSEWTSN